MQVNHDLTVLAAEWLEVTPDICGNSVAKYVQDNDELRYKLVDGLNDEILPELVCSAEKVKAKEFYIKVAKRN